MIEKENLSKAVRKLQNALLKITFKRTSGSFETKYKEMKGGLKPLPSTWTY